jgi:hypothetical protein
MYLVSAIGLFLSLFIQSYTLDVPLRKDTITRPEQVDDPKQTAHQKPSITEQWTLEGGAGAPESSVEYSGQ